jgi:peptidoglycan/xylan/chitin deacetylase (PgdA/CDA1 family)
MATLRSIFLSFLLPTLLCAGAAGAAEEAAISDYRPLFRPGYDSSGVLQIAIREFRRGDQTRLLLVNPVTLATSVAGVAALDPARQPDEAVIRNTPFIKALDRSTAPPYRLQNHGAVRAPLPAEGMFLTVDMCPSTRPFEKEFFTAVAGLSRENGRPAPLAIAMTGSWLANHRDELAWLVGLIREGTLAVTWVNHSYSHPYEPKAPLERNFLLTPGSDFEREVLATERLLLENGLLPSPFFRFPGLVADGRLLQKLRQLALIPIGSDAWLAKGENPTSGSFILVHGNGNEPQGIKKIMPLLRKESAIRLLPLEKAFAGME